jgi:CMP-N,N'-diacetyllegionaminic acid synthase
MKPLVIIPARGGSKGLPGKNIKILGSKPLIQYSIEVAREVFPDEVICVSTDDINIKDVSERLGLKVPFIRPAELATDTAGMHEVLLHALNHYETNGYFPDTIILLQATSPFRTGTHIKEALKSFNEQCDMVVSVKITKSNPYYILREENEDGWLVKSKRGNFTRRQDCPEVYEINGAIYIINISSLKKNPIHKFKKIKKFVMDEMSSHDIDNIFDWIVAQVIIDRKWEVIS